MWRARSVLVGRNSGRRCEGRTTALTALSIFSLLSVPGPLAWYSHEGEVCVGKGGEENANAWGIGDDVERRQGIRVNIVAVWNGERERMDSRHWSFEFFYLDWSISPPPILNFPEQVSNSRLFFSSFFLSEQKFPLPKWSSGSAPAVGNIHDKVYKVLPCYENSEAKVAYTYGRQQ